MSVDVVGDGERRDLDARVAALGRKAKALSNGQSWKVSLQMANFMEGLSSNRCGGLL